MSSTAAASSSQQFGTLPSYAYVPVEPAQDASQPHHAQPPHVPHPDHAAQSGVGNLLVLAAGALLHQPHHAPAGTPRVSVAHAAPAHGQKPEPEPLNYPIAPPETPGFNCDTFEYYWTITQLHIEKFITDYPDVALITGIACAILGLSYILPTAAMTYVAGAPLTGYGSLVFYTIYKRHDQFLEKFANSLAKHVKALGQAAETEDAGSHVFFPAPPSDYGFNCETVQYYLLTAQAHIEMFVLERPEVALITAIFSLIFGLPYFLPGVVVMFVSGVPLTALAGNLGYDIYMNWDKYMTSFSNSMARHARAAMVEARQKQGHKA